MKQQNNLITICSGTRGIGKTWFTGALSQCLSMQKQKVLFFDADGGIENIACQLGLKKSDLYIQMLKNKITLNNAVLPYAKGHFDVIYANPKENPLSTYPIGRSQILALDLKNFALNYDYVLIDCSNTNEKLKNIFLKSSARLIVIMEPNLSGITDAYKELEHLKSLDVQSKIDIVVNRALSYNEGEQIFKTLLNADAQFIGACPGLLGIIKQDGRIRDCILNKTTLFERYPICESLTDLQNLSKLLIKGEN